MTRASDRAGAGGGAGEQVDASTAAGSRGLNDQAAGAPDPWNSYTRYAAGAGWAAPVGRDQVRAALLDAGAFVDRLVIGWHRSLREDDLPGLRILSVRHSSDARGGYGRVRPSFAMTVYAVPSARRQHLRQELVGVWLPAACAWAASTSTRGNAWSASDHEWTLRLHGEGLVVSEH